MQALITLRNISFVTADGRTLFKNLNLTFGQEKTGLVGRNGVGKTTLLRIIGGSLRPTTGLPSFAGKIGILSQMSGYDTEKTVAELLGISSEIARVRRVLAGHGNVDDLEQVDWSLEIQVAAILNQAGLPDLDIDRPVKSLSGGQRTRAALARLMIAKPDIILLDEPTNNLDNTGREILREFLDGWKGGTVVASHDRDLLRRMERIIELSDLGIMIYGGNWDAYSLCKEHEKEAAALDLAHAERQAKETERRNQIVRERQERRNASGQNARLSGGQPKIVLDARANRASRTQGRGNLLRNRLQQESEERLSEAQAKVERLCSQDFSITSGKYRRNHTILALREIYGRTTAIRDLSFSIQTGERIALVGPNGSGKTTLLKYAAGFLTPLSGEISRYGRIVFMDQDVTLLQPADTILANFRRLHPEDTDNTCRAVLARFLFRADAALQKVKNLSGGERLRAGLACILGGSLVPDLLMLDEPTNHLDLQSITAMERALQKYAGALLIVSHDEAFLEAVGINRRIVLKGNTERS